VQTAFETGRGGTGKRGSFLKQSGRAGKRDFLKKRGGGVVMKMISWNVNGFRAVLKKGFAEIFSALDADIVCLQETKMQPGQAEFSPPGYHQYWYSAEKKGYSGTAVFTRAQPLNVLYGIGREEYDREGRALTLEYRDFYLVNLYAPNSQSELRRLDYRLHWEDALRAYLCALDRQKPVVVCGDLNVAHEEIDLKNPGPNRGSAGFTDEERAKLTQLLASGFADTFRALYPTAAGRYTWWSYQHRARATNAGWRIDYFLISERLRQRLCDALICSEIPGSDHCPVGLVLAP